MSQQADIKRLEDGSIDYAHYTQKGHAIRCSEMQRFMSRIKKYARNLFTRIVT